MRVPALILLLTAPLSAQEPISFQRDVQPLLRARCAGCHQPAKRKGKLDLTTHATILAGGTDAGVVVPGSMPSAW